MKHISPFLDEPRKSFASHIADVRTNAQSTLDRMDVEFYEKWVGVRPHIPYLQFPSEWKIKIMPPFGGAIARFYIEKNGIEVSVFLDFFGRLGATRVPYWEIMRITDPQENGEVYAKDDTKGLIEGIGKMLK